MKPTPKCLIDGRRNKQGVWHFQNYLISKWWNFCNFLTNVGGVVAIPKQEVGHRSENF